MILRNLSNRALFRLQVQSHYVRLRTPKTKMGTHVLLLAETYKKILRMKATAPRIFSTTRLRV